VDTILYGFPQRYKAQVQTQMACTNRNWCDFVSFDPRMPEGKRLIRIRVERDHKYISDIEKEVVEFLNELDDLVVTLNTRPIKS